MYLLKELKTNKQTHGSVYYVIRGEVACEYRPAEVEAMCEYRPAEVGAIYVYRNADMGAVNEHRPAAEVRAVCEYRSAEVGAVCVCERVPTLQSWELCVVCTDLQRWELRISGSVATWSVRYCGVSSGILTRLSMPDRHSVRSSVSCFTQRSTASNT